MSYGEACLRSAFKDEVARMADRGIPAYFLSGSVVPSGGVEKKRSRLMEIAGCGCLGVD